MTPTGSRSSKSSALRCRLAAPSSPSGGDLLVFYTDGVTEPENTFGEMFGEDRLTELLLRNVDRPEAEILSEVYAAVRQWTGAEELQDDLTLMLARRI